MKTLELRQMVEITAGTNRQCFIDGVVTSVLVTAGAFTAGFWGAVAGLAAGVLAGNADGCFNK